MNDFWNLSDGEDASASTNGEFDAGGGNMEPIPPETSVLAAIDEAKWDKDQQGNRFISLRWNVLAPEEFDNRKVFQKLWVLDADPRAKADKVAAKRDKAKRMLAAIDTNAGGKLLAKPVMPTDEAMTLHLTNKPMVVKVMLWSMRDSMTGEMMRGNWIGAVSPKSSAVSSSDEIERSKADMARAHANSAGEAQKRNQKIDDEIPF
jgi:hypothetical protein